MLIFCQFFSYQWVAQGRVMLLKKLNKISTNSFLIASLLLPASVSAKTDVDNPSLPISSQDFYSISVKPNRLDAATSYTLKIFSDQKESKQVVSTVRPLSGKVVDVEIYDIDDDGTEELVVMMVENVSASQKVNFDVFEFDGKELEWIEDFAPVSKLFKIYNKIYEK